MPEGWLHGPISSVDVGGWRRDGFDQRTSTGIEAPEQYYLLGSIGAALEFYWNLWPQPNSVEIELSQDIGHTSFGTLQQEGVARHLQEVAYTWTNLRARYIWWQHSVRHYAAAMGVSLGNPLINSDNDKVGRTLSGTFELGFMFRLQRFNGAWFEAVLGTRLWEQHRYFKDRDNSSESSDRSILQLYIAGRFRFRFG